MRDLWKLKLPWDEIVPGQLQNEWSKHCSNLSQLSSVSLPRSCINQNSVDPLCILCDASKSCYGFAIYSVVDRNSNLLFAKSKVAPNKPKTLPMLELLGDYLALKFFGSIVLFISQISRCHYCCGFSDCFTVASFRICQHQEYFHSQLNQGHLYVQEHLC